MDDQEKIKMALACLQSCKLKFQDIRINIDPMYWQNTTNKCQRAEDFLDKVISKITEGN